MTAAHTPGRTAEWNVEYFDAAGSYMGTVEVTAASRFEAERRAESMFLYGDYLPADFEAYQP